MKIKAILLSVAVMAASALTSINASAQDVFGKGTSTVSLLVGFGGTTYGANQKMLVPPLQLAYEYGVAEGLINGNGSIGVGVAGGYAASKYVIAGYGTEDYMTNNIGFVGARGSFHYQFVNNLDTYLGTFLGCAMSRVHTSSKLMNDAIKQYSSNAPTFTYGAYLGARYYFTPALGVNAEIGYGISIFNIGLTFRF